MRTPIVITKSDGTQKTIYAKNEETAREFVALMEEITITHANLEEVMEQYRDHMWLNSSGRSS